MHPPSPPCSLPNEPIPRVPPDVLVKLFLKMLRESLVGNAQLMGPWMRTLLSSPPCSHSGSSRSGQGQELEGPGGDAAGPPPPGACRAPHRQPCSVISSSAQLRLQFLRTSQVGAMVRQAGSISDSRKSPSPRSGAEHRGRARAEWEEPTRATEPWPGSYLQGVCEGQQCVFTAVWTSASILRVWAWSVRFLGPLLPSATNGGLRPQDCAL